MPTRAAGPFRPGQQIKLFYDAFPHQRFGVHQGRLEKIEKTILTPDEIGVPVVLEEPVYRATASIEKQTVTVYGEELSLAAGMLLKADIVLERQSLLEWLLDPILSLRGRFFAQTGEDV